MIPFGQFIVGNMHWAVIYETVTKNMVFFTFGYMRPLRYSKQFISSQASIRSRLTMPETFRLQTIPLGHFRVGNMHLVLSLCMQRI